MGHLVGQALEIRLEHVVGLACNHELTLQKGGLASKLTDLPVKRGQQGGALRCRTRFLCQNQILIVCMTQDQLFHTYGQKQSQITKCHE
jgi:hypothetical protein